MSEDNIAFRLKFLIENLGLTSSQFADKCDIARPTLSQLLSGRNKKISNLLIEQIHAAFPALSVLWLMFGEGDMWSNTNSISSTSNNTSSASQSSSCVDSTKSIGNEKTDIDTEIVKSPSDSINSKNNPVETPEFCTDVQECHENRKENGVNIHKNTSVNSNNKDFNQDLYTTDILCQIGKKHEKIRKVVQVTIYFDDSTFQTFYPNN